jgi:hypothetical protein
MLRLVHNGASATPRPAAPPVSDLVSDSGAEQVTLTEAGAAYLDLRDRVRDALPMLRAPERFSREQRCRTARLMALAIATPVSNQGVSPEDAMFAYEPVSEG